MEHIQLNPLLKGETHINIYSKSSTDLGKMLSNFYKTKFDTPYGKL